MGGRVFSRRMRMGDDVQVRVDWHAVPVGDFDGQLAVGSFWRFGGSM